MDSVKLDQLKVGAQNFGFDPSWIADVVSKFGPDALALVVELARQGFSVSLLTEVLDKFGPSLLQFFINYLNHLNVTPVTPKVGMTADVIPPGNLVEGIDANFIDMIVTNYLPVIIQKYLPMIVEKYGPQIVQFLVNWLTKNLQK